MEKTLPLEEKSISQIYFEGQRPVSYQVPIYQRNYAWEEDEIKALVEDVYDSYIKDGNRPYYIGTLVTYKRNEEEYEVIDGQQRLTTIYLTLKALGYDSIKNKLTYIARTKSADTITHLGEQKYTGEADTAINNGYKYAQNALKKVKDGDTEGFKTYFLHRVHIIHYSVPKDVDLNHYFEVMNSRGEQLEKHEIVKSMLVACVSSQTEMATFCRIWEACSEMSVYIQQTFPEEQIFGCNMSDFIIHGFDDIPQQDKRDGKETILSLLGTTGDVSEYATQKMQTDKFQPIIDFPNFLLQVLKVTLYQEGKKDLAASALDDKELLTEFATVLGSKEKAEEKTAFAKTFAYNLLLSKYLLDNYVVHHVDDNNERAGDNPWQLQRYYKESNNKRYPRNLLADNNQQDELVHLLSMFEVAFTARQRKNYLFYCLVHLFRDRDAHSYLDFMRNLADNYFYGVYLNEKYLNERRQPRPNAFDDAFLDSGSLILEEQFDTSRYRQAFENIYPAGECNIPLFVFNYADYRLWRKYADEMRGKQYKKESQERAKFFDDLGCSDFELDAFKYFYFSRTRKSLEHFYPQACGK